ncbi:E3 SUMO-protein ligase ZBED1-like isoform X3 [Scophthalmus maximus]|uniref:E3 SUMO-protein ligase ZBED1-like isoform X3 n=1 Tax=Scophthalmus maximus TaxID=52904 RepID=UPI001FA911BE|nr:E3 SUMO-protein ligase ZBED1-like isoform X3 [Scophthalmus maximus]
MLHFKCFAHTLNLASQRALKLTPVARLLGRVRRITSFFRRSTTASHVLREKQKLLNLPQHKLLADVVTRWNSAPGMLQRFLEQQPAIHAALLSAEVRKTEKEICTLSESDITAAEEVVTAMKPMKVATLVMSQETTPTLSVVAPLHAQLIHDLQDSPTDSNLTREIKSAVCQDLKEKTNARTSVLESSQKLQGARGHFSRVRLEWRQERQTDVNVLPEDDEDSNQGAAKKLKTAEDQAKEEMARYKEEAPMPLVNNPLDWWKDHQSEYPLLSHVAKRYLCIPGTSVSSERVFSTAGDIITAQRSALSPDHLDQILVLNKNLKK